MSLQNILKMLIAALAGALIWIVVPTLELHLAKPGDTAPDFAIKAENGRNMTPRDFGGKVLVLNFWATWCAPCIEEFPELNRFAAEHAKDGVVVFGVSIDKNEKLYRQFLQSVQPSFPTTRDPEAGIAASYGTFRFPETYVIDKNGKVAFKVEGPIRDWQDLRTRVKALI